MNCEQIREKLTAYLLGDLDPETTAEIRGHLETCDGCRAAAREIEPTLDLLRDALAATSSKSPKKLWPEKRARVMRARPTGIRKVIRWFTVSHPRMARAAVILVAFSFIWVVSGELMFRSCGEMFSSFGGKLPASATSRWVGPLRVFMPVFKMGEVVGGGSATPVECVVVPSTGEPASDHKDQSDRGDMTLRAEGGKDQKVQYGFKAKPPASTLGRLFSRSESKAAPVRPAEKLDEASPDLQRRIKQERDSLSELNRPVTLPEREQGAAAEYSVAEEVSSTPKPGQGTGAGSGVGDGVTVGGQISGAKGPLVMKGLYAGRSSGERGKALREVAPADESADIEVEVAEPQARSSTILAGNDGSRSGSDAGRKVAPTAEAAPATPPPAESKPQSVVAMPSKPAPRAKQAAEDSIVRSDELAMATKGFSAGKEEKVAEKPKPAAAGMVTKSYDVMPTINEKIQAAQTEVAPAVGEFRALEAAPVRSDVEQIKAAERRKRRAYEVHQTLDSTSTTENEKKRAINREAESLERAREEVAKNDKDMPVAADALVTGGLIAKADGKENAKRQQPRNLLKSHSIIVATNLMDPGQMGETALDVVKGSKEKPSEEELAGPRFKAAGVNPFVKTIEQAFSTFSIGVDTASYTLMRNYMLKGYLPPAESVRTEEFVNFFDYAYKAPTRETFRIYVDTAPSKFGHGLHLMKIGVKGRRLGREEQRKAMLTFLVDTSGSMDKPDRIGLVKKSLRMLVEKMAPQDMVAIIQYDSHARLVLEFTPVSDKKKIFAAIDALQCGGSTNLEEGMMKAYELAAKNFAPGGESRVLLLSDGVANLGTMAAEDILKAVESYRKQGIFCSVFGVGMGTYDDTMLQTLAAKGDGTYAFLDSEEEAKRVFVDDLSATLNTIAKDVKIQVEFNPKAVAQYRQLGYESRQLKKEDFRNDAVDAGEVGSGQSVTALYELGLADRGQGTGIRNQGSGIRSQDSAEEDRIATVRVRYRRMDNDKVEEIEQPVKWADIARSFDEADVRFRLAAGVAEFSEILRGSPFAEGSEFKDVADMLRPVALDLSLDSQVQELLRLVSSANGMSRAPVNE
jgi:Ca-activated chloride channel family protein